MARRYSVRHKPTVVQQVHAHFGDTMFSNLFKVAVKTAQEEFVPAAIAVVVPPPPGTFTHSLHFPFSMLWQLWL